MEPGNNAGARTFQQRLDAIGYSKEDKLRDKGFIDLISGFVMDKPTMANDSFIYNEDSLTTMVKRGDRSPIKRDMLIAALFPARDKFNEIEAFVKKQEKKYAERNNPQAVQAQLPKKAAVEHVEKMEVETHPTVYGEFTWSYIYSFENTLYEIHLKDISQAHLGIDIKNAADFLWQMAANGAFNTKNGLRTFYDVVGLKGCLRYQAPEKKPDRPPPAPMKLRTLNELLSTIGLPYFDSCAVFADIGQSCSESFSQLALREKISNPLLLLRKLFDSGKAKNVEELAALVDKYGTKRAASLLRGLANTTASSATVSQPNNNNSQQTNAKSLEKAKVELLFRDLPPSVLKAISTHELRQNEKNGFLIFGGLQTQGKCNNDQQASKLFEKYNISGLTPFIHKPAYSFQTFSKDLVNQIQKLYGNIDKNILSRMQEREIEAELQMKSIFQDYIIEMLILSGKVKDTQDFAAYIDKYNQ